jgi:hypothetical protein
MIEPFFPFLILSLKSKREEVEEWKPTREDYDELREGMKKYSLERRNGRLLGKFEQYMIEKDVLRLSDDGRLEVVWPLGFSRYCQTKVGIDLRDEDEQKRFFDENPEEYAKWKERITELGSEIRSIIQKTKV